MSLDACRERAPGVTVHVAADTVFALAAGKLGRAGKRDSLAVLVNPSDVVLVQGPEWRAQTIHTSDDAIVAVDGSGSVYLAWNDAGRWRQQTLWQDQAPLYAVAAADLDPTAPGLEIAVGGESSAVTLLARRRPTPLR